MKKLERRWLLLAGPTVTLTLSFSLTYDGVGPIKLLSLAFFAGLGLEYVVRHRKVFVMEKPLSILLNIILVFLLGLFIAVLFSGAPISQQVYGTTGRNIGLLHYFFLSCMLLFAATLNSDSVCNSFLFTLLPVGIFQALYSICQWLGFDPAAWNNPEGWMLGTLGNPNYVSSLLGISVTASLFAVSEKVKSAKLLFLHIFNVLLGTFVVVLSNSIQGLVLIAVGLVSLSLILGFRCKKVIGIVLLTFFGVLAFFSLIGILQQGPLRHLLYQNSVSVRGDYWRAGLSMFKSNFFTGVGLDSYGDHYQQFRSIEALNRNGLESYSNSAHNLFIDLAATGGILAIISYTCLQIFLLVLIIRLISTSRNLPNQFYSLVTIWIAFNLQTTISINVSSLAIWGWITSGMIVAYYRRTRTELTHHLKQKNVKKANVVISLLVVTLFTSVVSPLLVSQRKFADALLENDFQKISNALMSFPRDGQLIGKTAAAYQQLGRSNESLTLARKAISVNSRSLDAWEVIYYDATTSLKEKRRALRNLLSIDPMWKPQE